MTSFELKLLAMISMLIDHIGFIFLSNSNLYDIFRIIGRFAFPIFAFQLAVGYTHSKSKEKYILRMLIFAIVSQIPFTLFIKNALSQDYFSLNIGFTLSFGLMTMYAIDKIKNIPLKLSVLYSVFLFSFIVPIDYGLFGVLLCMSFYIFRNHKFLSILSTNVLVAFKMIYKASLFYFPMIFALIPIMLYNGKKGFDNKFSKYLFYIMYPTHLLLFAVIKMII